MPTEKTFGRNVLSIYAKRRLEDVTLHGTRPDSGKIFFRWKMTRTFSAAGIYLEEKKIRTDGQTGNFQNFQNEDGSVTVPEA